MRAHLGSPTHSIQDSLISLLRLSSQPSSEALRLCLSGSLPAETRFEIAT